MRPSFQNPQLSAPGERPVGEELRAQGPGLETLIAYRVNFINDLFIQIIKHKVFFEDSMPRVTHFLDSCPRDGVEAAVAEH